MSTIKVKLYRPRNIGFEGGGAKLKSMRVFRHFTKAQLTIAMNSAGWPWHGMRVKRLEDLAEFELHPEEMQDLLNILGASGI